MTSTRAPLSGEHFGRLQGRVVAGVVEQQHVAPGCDIAAQDVPARHHQVVAAAQHLGVRQATGGNDHDVGPFGQHRGPHRPGC
jgi:hypothetical protein